MARSSSSKQGASGARSQSERTDAPAAKPAETEPPSPAPVKKLRAIDLIAGARQQLKELTGYEIDSVAGFHKSDDGWALTVTVLELNRIPTATDVLAEYIVDLDADGDITAYRRGRRFYRGEVGTVETT